jgi:flagellar hook-associated protein 2
MASVDGLISGLNTTDIIRQLMQLERQPQVRLQTKKATVESAIGALRNLNTKFLAITTAAAKMTEPQGWTLATAASSDPAKVSVTATAAASPGSLSFNVKQLASAASYLSSGSVASTSTAVAEANSTLYLTKADGTTTEIATGDGSLAAVMKAVNASGAGVSATAVQLTPGEYSLKLESTTTGAKTGFTVGLTPGADDAFTATLGTMNALVEPKDAELMVGGSLVTRSSNTISDLLSGVTLTLAKADTLNADGTFVEAPTTIDVKADTEKVAAQVAALVEAVNVASADIKAVTGYNVEAGNKGKLYGDAGVRGLRDRLTGSITGTGTAVAGVSIDRNGVVTFDKEKFLEALDADPAAVQAALGNDGLAGRLHAVADGASRSKTAAEGPGLIANSITSRERQVTSLKSNISSWDNRLELRERTLQRQYAALEKALGASQSQGQWLAGQIAGLPSWGG